MGCCLISLSENLSVASAAGNVAGAVKALTDLRHQPASPGVLRRAQILMQNQQPQQQQQQMANNPQVSTKSCFREWSMLV